MKIFDTLSVTEKELDASNGVRIYLCGVTVYDDSHIGHARTIIVFDTLRRFLESQGIKVKFIQNFTDVDDKIINRAVSEDVSADKISSRYISNYFTEFDRLNVKRADMYPKATEHIEAMIDLIKTLIEKGFAYVSANGVYFSVSKFHDYGKLSKKKIDELVSGARVEVDDTKKDPLDFALWKFADDDPKWQSPWGAGRPGWHIECSAMSLKYLGADFEIHGGGRDLIFPHHENEIAQSESYSGKNFAKIWMHVGMVTIGGEKMSKSLGNTKSVDFVLKKWGANIIRLFCLLGHYSKPIDYSEEMLKETITKWRQVENCYYELILSDGSSAESKDIESMEKISTETKKEFFDSLNYDFNTSLAIGAFFKLVKATNQVAASECLTKPISGIVLPILEQMLDVLGLKISGVSEEEKRKIDSLIEKRNLLRNEKKFQEADVIRKELSDIGIMLIDHKRKVLWMKQEKIGDGI
ncbi:MAG TPA: cysteine--tRNA ligase [Candidatus Nitrosotalea sp.]|nr:cysteine--tRNA ligase [Candidatus Nitrosotalea sp.]